MWRAGRRGRRPSCVESDGRLSTFGEGSPNRVCRRSASCSNDRRPSRRRADAAPSEPQSSLFGASPLSRAVCSPSCRVVVETCRERAADLYVHTCMMRRAEVDGRPGPRPLTGPRHHDPSPRTACTAHALLAARTERNIRPSTHDARHNRTERKPRPPDVTRATNGNGHVSCLEMTKLVQGGRPGRQPHSSSAGGCVTVL